MKEQIRLGTCGQESRMHDKSEQVKRKRYTKDVNSKRAWAGSE